MKTLKLTALSLCLSLAAFAQTVVTKEGVGEAAIVKNDEAKAFEQARDAALRNAIEQAAGVRIDADTVVVNNQLVRDQVFANTSGYVKSFDVIDRKAEKGVLTVKVKATVITENLEKDVVAARDLVKKIGRPKVMIVVQENTLPADGKAVIVTDTLAGVLTEAMRADGYDVKDRAFANGKISVGAGIALQQAEAKTIGDLSKADFIIYGSANFRHHPNFTSDELAKDPASAQAKAGMFNNATYMVSGEYELAVFATKTGAQMAKFSNKLTWRDNTGLSKSLVSYERTTQALVKHRQDDIMAELRRAILEYYREQYVNGGRFELQVSGLDSFGAAKEFKRAMESLKGFKDATQDSFGNGKAAYRVTFLGSAEDFAEQLESSTFKKKKLTVISQNGNTLEVAVAK